MKRYSPLITLLFVGLSLFSCAGNGDSSPDNVNIRVIVSKKNAYKRKNLTESFHEKNPSYTFEIEEKEESQIDYYLRHDQLNFDVVCVEDLKEIRKNPDQFVDFSRTEYLNRFSKTIIHYTTLADGRVNTLPSPGGFYCYCINDDLLKQFNFTTPTSLSLLTDYASYISRTSSDIVPFVSAFSGDRSYLDLFMQATVPSYFSTPKGNDVFQKFYSGQALFQDSDQYASIRNLLTNNYRNRYSSGFAKQTEDGKGSSSSFFDGKALCRSVSPDFDFQESLLSGRSTGIATYKAFDYSFVPFCGNENDSWLPTTSDFFYALNKRNYTGKKKKALDALSNYFSSKEGQTILRKDERGNVRKNLINYLNDSSFSLEGAYQSLNPLIQRGRIYFVDDFLAAFRSSTSSMKSYIQDDIDVKSLIMDRDFNRSMQNNYAQNAVQVDDLVSIGDKSKYAKEIRAVLLKAIKNYTKKDFVLREDSFLKEDIFDGTRYEDELDTIFDPSVRLTSYSRTGEELLRIRDDLETNASYSQYGLVKKDGQYRTIGLSPIVPSRTYRVLISDSYNDKTNLLSKGESLSALDYLKEVWFQYRR